MAEISIVAMNENMPMMPHAWLEDYPWIGGGTVKRLVLAIGNDTIHVWPADKEVITKLADKLHTLAKRL